MPLRFPGVHRLNEYCLNIEQLQRFTAGKCDVRQFIDTLFQSVCGVCKTTLSPGVIFLTPSLHSAQAGTSGTPIMTAKLSFLELMSCHPCSAM